MARSSVLALFVAGLACAAAAAPSIATCAKVAKALGVVPDGKTLFCPDDAAWNEFAGSLAMMGEKGTPVPQLLATAAANPPLFKSVLLNHVVPGVLPAAKLKNGAALTTAGKTALRAVGAKGSWTITYPSADAVAEGDDADEAATVEATDLTFQGPYSPSSKYVVHAIDTVMVPKAAATGLAKIKAVNLPKLIAAQGRRRLIALWRKLGW